MKNSTKLQLNELSTHLEWKNNTFVLPHNLSCSALHIERCALTSALNENLGIIYSTSTTDNKILDSIKNQCEDAGKKVFLVSFTEPTFYNGLNPFLNLEPEQISQFFFKPDSKEYEQLKSAFENNTEPTTPETVLKIILQNDALFANKEFEPLVENLEAIVTSINPFNNINKAINIDLSSVINEGHILILGGLNNLLLADEYRAFINDYFLKPLFGNNQINTSRKNKTFTITSSESAIDTNFTEKVFAHGNQLNIKGLYTEYRTSRSYYESIQLIYANSHNKIKGNSKNLNLINRGSSEEAEVLEFYLSQLDGTEQNFLLE